jgi:hypothetical protein
LLLPRRDNAVLTAVLNERRDKDDRRVGRETGGGIANDTVDLAQPKRLQAGRQLAAQLFERDALLFCGAALRELALLAHDAEDQQDHRRRRNQNGGQQERDPALPAPGIRGTHVGILEVPRCGRCHGNVMASARRFRNALCNWCLSRTGVI